VAEETSESPYAWSFLTLLAALSIIDGKELPMPSEAPQYLVARLTKALAEDPRTAELGVHVTVRGDQVRLSGQVACENRKADVEAVICEHIAAELVHNDVRLADVREPARAEEIR
jgi:hypothetical protein